MLVGRMEDEDVMTDEGRQQDVTEDREGRKGKVMQFEGEERGKEKMDGWRKKGGGECIRK